MKPQPAKPKPASKPVTKGRRFVVVCGKDHGGPWEAIKKASAMLTALVPSTGGPGIIRMTYTPLHEEMP